MKAYVPLSEQPTENIINEHISTDREATEKPRSEIELLHLHMTKKSVAQIISIKGTIF